MDLFTAVHTRRSIRSFVDKEVSDADLEKILSAAMAAPSAGNQQPWSFVVVKDKEKLSAITKVHPYAKTLADAPLAIIVCGQLDGKWPEFWPQDCSSAVQNILLSARGLGLGSCWMGLYPEQDRMEGVRKICSIPEEILPFAIIPIGYSDTEFKAIARFKEERVFSDSYGVGLKF